MKKEKDFIYPYGTKLGFKKSANYTVNFSVVEESKRPKKRTTYDVSVELAVKLEKEDENMECVVFFDPKQKKLAVDSPFVGIAGNQVRVTEESLAKPKKEKKNDKNSLINTTTTNSIS